LQIERDLVHDLLGRGPGIRRRETRKGAEGAGTGQGERCDSSGDFAAFPDDAVSSEGGRRGRRPWYVRTAGDLPGWGSGQADQEVQGQKGRRGPVATGVDHRRRRARRSRVATVEPRPLLVNLALRLGDVDGQLMAER